MASKLPRSWPPSVSPNLHDSGRQVHFETHSIMACKLPSLRPPCVSLKSLHYGLQVHLQNCSTTASKLTRLWPQSVSPNSLDYGLEIHVQTPSLTASRYILPERRRVYGDTGVREVERVTGSTYSADLRGDRHHLISISSYHTMTIHTLHQ